MVTVHLGSISVVERLFHLTYYIPFHCSCDKDPNGVERWGLKSLEDYMALTEIKICCCLLVIGLGFGEVVFFVD